MTMIVYRYLQRFYIPNTNSGTRSTLRYAQYVLNNSIPKTNMPRPKPQSTRNPLAETATSSRAVYPVQAHNVLRSCTPTIQHPTPLCPILASEHHPHKNCSVLSSPHPLHSVLTSYPSPSSLGPHPSHNSLPTTSTGLIGFATSTL